MPTAPPASPSACTPKSKRPHTLSLPVLPSAPSDHHHDRNAWDPAHSKIKHSRSGRRRALVLILVHVIFLIHLTQWLIVGLTVSPVEPSESMYTLKNGLLNAGFVFFALAILSTLVFGRFFCGWGCHIVAVQDLCSWIMMRCGLKPKPFRSRLLLLAPVGLAVYMFLWPTLAREVLRPMLADARGRLPTFLGGGVIEGLPGVRPNFLITNFWDTFAQWYIAIPFILTCAVATVYFLGAKAFCTYGCPYGGIFAPVDLLSVGKIKVNDNCEHCGHCTAVCTSNVRVHEEVRDFGMVVDPGCMKCLDCISVCPNDALSFGLGVPSIFAKPRTGTDESRKQAKALRRARYDLSWPEEILCAIIFLLLFLCFRGMLNQVPMLMAVAMGFLGAWACWKSWRLFIDPSSRVHALQLKLRGTIRPVGYAFLLITLASLAIAAWSGLVRLDLHRATLAYQQLETPIDIVLRSDFAPTPQEAATARRALDFYRKGSPPKEGGIAILWPLRADEWINIAYLHLLINEQDQAEHALQRAIDIGHPQDSLVFQLAQVMNTRSLRRAEALHLLGAPEGSIKAMSEADGAAIEAVLADALAKHDDLFAVRDHLLRRKLPGGENAVKQEWAQTLQRYPHSTSAPLTAAVFFRDIKDNDAAIKLIDRALAQRNITPDNYLQAAGLLASMSQNERAEAVARKGAAAGLRLPAPRAAAAQFFVQIKQAAPAADLASQAVYLARARPDIPGRTGALFEAAKVRLSLGEAQAGLALAREAVDSAAGNPWDLAPMGAVLVQAGGQMQEEDMVNEGVKLLERARDANPAAPSLHHDLAQAYYFVNRTDDALREVKAAAELAPASSFLASRYADLLREAGRADEAAQWNKLAIDRARVIMGAAP